MAVPAEVFFRLYQEVLMFSAMDTMAFHAGVFPERAVHGCAPEAVIDFFMATQTDRGNIIVQQPFHIAYMSIVTGNAFTLFKESMDIRRGKPVFQSLMAVIAEGGYLCFQVWLGIGSIASEGNDHRKDKTECG